MINNFLDLLKEKVIVFDGAMGSNLQWQNLTIIEKVHTGFLDVGYNVIETNSFGGGEIYHGNLPDGGDGALLIFVKGKYFEKFM